MESHHSQTWADKKHTPSKRTNVQNLIRAHMERGVTFPKDHALPLLSLALGEPTKANGYELPDIINEAVIEAV